MIAIIGNNLTAKVAFLYFKKLGIDCLLLAKNYTKNEFENYKSTFSSRTMAISNHNLDILSQIIDLEKIKNISGEIKTIYILNDIKSKSPEIIFNASDYGYENMGYIVYYNALCEEIESELLQYEKSIISNVEAIFENENQFKIISQNQEFILDNLIVTDKTLDDKLSFIEKSDEKKYDYFESAITLNIKHKMSHNQVAIEHFTNLGPLASLPMKNEFESNIVRTVPRNIIQALKAMNNDEKREFILKYLISPLEYHLGNIEITSEISVFPLSLRLLKQPNNKNIIFLGTYNFTMHPIAGQGFNVVLRDIERLKNSIVNQKISEFQSLFSRKIDISSMLFTTHGLNQLFKISNPIISSVRKIGMKIFNNTSFLKKFAFKNAIGCGVFNKI